MMYLADVESEIPPIISVPCRSLRTVLALSIAPSLLFSGSSVRAETVYSVTQYSYDAVGRLECTAVRMNPAVYGSLPPSACTLGTAGTAGPDRITRNVYDAAGQLTKVQKAVGTTLAEDYATYTYSANGKQTSMTDARGYRADFTYDGFDRQKRWYFPSKTTTGVASTTDYEEYGYDSNGNRTSLRKRDGSVITYTYDALNRVTLKNVPTRAGLAATHTRDVYYGYDLLGQLLYARFDNASGEGVATTYGGFGRVTSNTMTMDGVTRTLRYDYDANGNRLRMSFPDGDLSAYAKNVTYAYDGLDRPVTLLRENTATIASYSYDAAGKRSTFNGGINTSYGYDASGRLSSLTNNPAVNTAYNNNWTFAYNPASQITQTTRSNDSFAWTGAVNVDRNYTTNGINQYTAAGTASFGYDNNGNLTSDGTSTYNYDIENRLVTRVAGGVTTTLRYDPLGRLYEVASSTGTTRFLHDGDALVGEYDTAGTLLRRYVHGTDGESDDPVAWYEGATFASTSERVMRPDWQGSIVLVTDSTGNTVHAINRYDEYGIPQGTNTGRFQYTGQAWLAELGMYYYKARIYSPTLGRFLQTDPIGYEDQVNLYAYVANDPINGVDPTGMACVGQGSDFCDRSDVYREIQSDPAINSKTDFFEGVASMTDNLANLDLPLGEFVAGLDEGTASALNDLSGQILEFNKDQAGLVRSGKISGTREEINALLVAREQGFIEGKLAQMPAEMRKNVVGAMTDSANGIFAKSVMYVTDPIPALAASATRSQLRGPIDFGNIRHRIQFGVNLMRLVSGQR